MLIINHFNDFICMSVILIFNFCVVFYGGRWQHNAGGSRVDAGRLQPSADGRGAAQRPGVLAAGPTGALLQPCRLAEDGGSRAQPSHHHRRHRNGRHRLHRRLRHRRLLFLLLTRCCCRRRRRCRRRCCRPPPAVAVDRTTRPAHDSIGQHAFRLADHAVLTHNNNNNNKRTKRISSNAAFN